jgi:hypothetical protein
MTVANVAERTSKAVEEDGDGGSLFDETAGWYARLRERSERIINDTLANNAQRALHPYRTMYVAQSGNHSVESCLLWQQPLGYPQRLFICCALAYG